MVSVRIILVARNRKPILNLAEKIKHLLPDIKSEKMGFSAVLSSGSATLAVGGFLSRPLLCHRQDCAVRFIVTYRSWKWWKGASLLMSDYPHISKIFQFWESWSISSSLSFKNYQHMPIIYSFPLLFCA